VISTYKAKPTGNELVADLNIVATETMPDFPRPLADDWEAKWHAILDDEATKIVDAITNSLPGGVLSRIHYLLAKRYANSLAIAWKEMQAPDTEAVEKLKQLPLTADSKRVPHNAILFDPEGHEVYAYEIGIWWCEKCAHEGCDPGMSFTARELYSTSDAARAAIIEEIKNARADNG
jgi:hypothetical protein